jgi:hypothetical protein
MIGVPENIERQMHVEQEESAPSGFSGLPQEWEIFILRNGITREEIKEHPQQAMEAAATYKEGGPKPMISSKKLRETIRSSFRLES